jgi:hypothetical protein
MKYGYARVSTEDQSQTRAVLSSDAVTTRLPSGLNDALETWPMWPASTMATGVGPG